MEVGLKLLQPVSVQPPSVFKLHVPKIDILRYRVRTRNYSTIRVYAGLNLT